jgi:hypothetical protein
MKLGYYDIVPGIGYEGWKAMAPVIDVFDGILAARRRADR